MNYQYQIFQRTGESNVDTSAYIVVPEEKEEEDMPTWYSLI